MSTLIVPIGGDYSLPCMYVCVQVTGDSIFNLLALADIETDKDDRPVYPQKILSVEVVIPLMFHLVLVLLQRSRFFYLFYCYL